MNLIMNNAGWIMETEVKSGLGRTWAIIALGAAVAVPAILGIGAAISFSHTDNICRGVVVSGIELGGKTRAQAAGLIAEWARMNYGRRITFTALDSRWTGTLADFGVRIESKQALNRAYSIGRDGNIFVRAACVLREGGPDKRFEIPITINKPRVEKAIDKIARAVNRPHRDARVRVINGELHIEQDATGIKLDKQSSVEIVSQALVGGKPLVSLPVQEDWPDVTSGDAAKITTLLGRFTTWFNRGKVDRTRNVELAAKSIDGVIIKPGDEFSYNKVVGPREEYRGFRNAPIFVKGKLEPGIGGGICQVSSTLYNAALLAGMEIVERHNHSRTVPYVSPGRDATVAYGLRDFRFKNSGSAPIAVLSHIKGSYLTIDVYGAADDKKEVKILASRTGSRPYGTETVVDPSLPPGVSRVEDKGSSGVNVVVYRKITQPDGKIRTELLSRDRYSAQPRVILVGPSALKPAGNPTPPGNT